MKILVINSGSSSIKFQLFKMPEKKVLMSGLVEKIGLTNSEIHFKTDNIQQDLEIDIPNHTIGIEKIVELLMDKNNGVIKQVDEIGIVGHRVVHGGKDFLRTTQITTEVKNKIKERDKK